MVTCILALFAMMIIGGLGLWTYGAKESDRLTNQASVASAEVVGSYYKRLAALDVEENELAVEVLRKTLQQQPGEPALWTNLAVAQLRLRDLTCRARC